jgi:hypothetical protein
MSFAFSLVLIRPHLRIIFIKKGFTGEISTGVGFASQRVRSISFPKEKEDVLNVLSASQKLQKLACLMIGLEKLISAK